MRTRGESSWINFVSSCNLVSSAARITNGPQPITANNGIKCQRINLASRGFPAQSGLDARPGLLDQMGSQEDVRLLESFDHRVKRYQPTDRAELNHAEGSQQTQAATPGFQARVCIIKQYRVRLQFFRE